MRSFRIAALNAQMRYFDFVGSGVPLFMIHGLGCASSFEYPPVALAPASRGRHVVLVDLLGFGFSDHPEAFGYDVQDHARLVADMIGTCGTDQVDLYGHSMGGSIAIEVADLLGGRLRRLVVSEPNLDSGGGTFSRPIAAMNQADYVHYGHQVIVEQAWHGGDEGWAATMRLASARAVHRGATSLVAGSTPDWRSRFLRHPARKAFIFGEYSLPDEDAAILPSYGIQVLVVPSAGHSMSLENPHGLAEAIAQATA